MSGVCDIILIEKEKIFKYLDLEITAMWDVDVTKIEPIDFN